MFLIDDSDNAMGPKSYSDSTQRLLGSECDDFNAEISIRESR